VVSRFYVPASAPIADTGLSQWFVFSIFFPPLDLFGAATAASDVRTGKNFGGQFGFRIVLEGKRILMGGRRTLFLLRRHGTNIMRSVQAKNS